jgi:large subunit ribosomal protein L25
MNMEVGKLTVTRRNTSGKGNATKLRQQNLVPGICYGASPDGKIEPVLISVNVKALRAALDPVRKANTVLDLTIEGGSAAPQKLHALVKDYQIDTLRRDIIHVDLLAIDPNKEVVAEVPIEFIGKPAGAIDGGQLRIVLRDLTVRSKPNDIPIKLSVDVSSLGIGDVIHVSAIALPPGVLSITNRDLAVVTCQKPEEEKVEVPVEGVVLAPGAVAAAGAAPAAGAAAPAAGAKPGDAKAAAAPAAGAKGAPAAPAAAKKK